ncbi:hypothetical protein [Thalassotalea sp. PS06]|uniref:hypothetical protein n=1 Tax=Thalassotalea sp. PS06 TaxID=2594005 RepID=UPI0011635EB4|nr:hypothetical protein [Thalassotalea sp. PS06]QDP01071.1 hypothetical protein FNC98_06770 [Thalassotalea sp. PS06]
MVYTRNIADPDYGAKLTGREGDHSFGFFTTRDQQTNLIISDNIGSNLATLNEESFSSALRYRYDASRDLSLGVISTIRNSDNYFNVLTGVDGKYKVTDSNQITAQFMYSNSEYEQAALEQLCFTPQDSEIYCIKSSLLDKNKGEFSDTAYKLRYDHNSADWKAHINYENLGKDFRADLGYMPEIDIKKFTTGIERIVYGDDTWWTDLFFGTNYQIKHSQNNELIAKTNALIFGIFGPMQSYVQLEYFWEDKVGDRINEQSQDISGNTTLFSLNNISAYGLVQPLSVLTLDLYMQIGDSIDYINNRVGDGVLIIPSFTWNMTKQAELNFAYNYSTLDVDGDWLYKENVTDLRLGYQFNINSALKLNLVYTDSDFNDRNYLVPIGMSETDDLSAQLIYSYTINPQTLFFLGFSAGKYDMFSQDIQRNRLMKMYQQEQQTAFLKLSYAWM